MGYGGSGIGGASQGAIPSYKYGTGSGIGGSSLGQAGLNSFGNIPKYSTSGIAGGIGTLNPTGSSSGNNDNKF